MPSFMAFVIACLAAWSVVQALPVQPGNPIPMILAMIVWLMAFYFVRRWFLELRP